MKSKVDYSEGGLVELQVRSVSPKVADSVSSRIMDLFEKSRTSGPEALKSKAGTLFKFSRPAKIHSRKIVIQNFTGSDVQAIEELFLPSLVHLDFKVIDSNA